MTFIKTALLAGVAMATMAGAANATQINYYYDSLTNSTFTATGVATATSTPATVGQFVASFQVPNFNAALGTLNSITISFSVAGSVSAIMNGNPGDAYANVIVGIPYTLRNTLSGASALNISGEGYADNPPGNSNASTGYNYNTASGGSPGAGFNGNLAASGTSTIGTNTFGLPANAYTQTISGAGLTPYIASSGAASFSFRTGSADIVQGNIPQNDLLGANSLETVKVTVVEDYTPTPPATVPEPASIALLGAGLLGLGLIRRKSA